MIEQKLLAVSIAGAEATLPPLQLGAQFQIERKEVNENVLHNFIRTTGSDGDDAARARRVQRERKLLERGTYPRAQATLEHELGRGHRRKWQTPAPYALEAGGSTLTYPSTVNHSLLQHVYLG